jgi:hypothetical protein
LLDPLLPVEDFRLAWLAVVWPMVWPMLTDAVLTPVLPNVWEAFFAVTDTPVGSLVVAAVFMLLTISFVLFTYDTFFASSAWI